MFLFGHIGLTLGAALAVTSLVDARQKAAVRRKGQTQPGQDRGDFANAPGSNHGLSSLVESLGRFMDLRLLAIGSMLPDIIDKPLGLFLFGEGRVFTHSLIVTLLVLLTGVFLYFNYKHTAVLAVACGMVSHLILDFMWMSPEIFLWPLYGWSFPAGERSSHILIWLSDLVSVPGIYLTELAGLIILAILAGVLVNKKKLWTLLKTGCL
jgi:inner membrane protein